MADKTTKRMLKKFNIWCENEEVRNTFVNFIWWKENIYRK